MEDYNKIIESLGIRYLKSNNIIVNSPFQIVDYQETDNAILILKRGKLFYGEERNELKEGHALFIPAGKIQPITFGDPANLDAQLTQEEFGYRQMEFFHTDGRTDEHIVSDFSMVVFETKVFDTVNFFSTLDIPPFSIENPKVNTLIYEIMKEQSQALVGSQRMIKLRTELLCIEIIRHILTRQLFVEQMTTNSTYFKDPRLISLLKFIKDNLDGELTNKRLSEIADVSEDYVGQYFKTLTGINPQDYIEYQRMEHAVDLLRTTKMSIRDIGRACGYKDTAYFCRRFKMMYGIPAGKMRKRETLMNV
ncbi:helix-turn-helix domain-containing protein [Fulvivirga sedimenti]|uniref:AraC family transcriptional regulator n=1 Tax=Fulvivirga sedimenti TaxID=2879465 RepID=A0A9X1HM29_9BACT|nr:AraC family transcriptional regulator [Fulvivirga sedimenti]MCA6074376.1 AraC family transcriptional regulator [Fulvivirga sedimenti]